ncbi:related to integral membrane protein PTH11 [Phialocephala subalpina]|uniref:Related to integral membrane protein PTH11 n=1 Tax=Phialocephala subalpina TaxID=576137 RepID=A0A1L7XV07_9HELO|nr:related to integral membrane protein PTH11 [Phialocephala subalpina]
MDQPFGPGCEPASNLDFDLNPAFVLADVFNLVLAGVFNLALAGVFNLAVADVVNLVLDLDVNFVLDLDVNLNYLDVVSELVFLCSFNESFGGRDSSFATVICLANAVVNSTCSPTDQQCICTDAPLNAQVNVCVQSTCTIKESLKATLNVTSTACGHPIRDRRLLYNVISNVFGVSSGVAVVLRLLSRYLADSRLWLDDYTILFVMAIGIPSSVINVHGLTSNGLGKDIWTLTFKNISDVIHVRGNKLTIPLSLVKISILLFYLRLFPGTTIRRVIYATITFNVLVGLTFDLIALLQCRPIDFYWKRWDGEHKGKCLNINALAWANAAINIASDLWLLGLPMTQLVRLNLHWKKKVGVAMMFGVGTFVTAVSILRLQSLVLFANSQNPTWDNVPVGYWSTMEINVGIICSCMPSIRLLLIRAFPKVMSTTKENSKYSYDQSGSLDKRNITRIRDQGGYVYNKSVDIGRSRDPTDEIGSSNLELVHIGKRAEDI